MKAKGRQYSMNDVVRRWRGVPDDVRVAAPGCGVLEQERHKLKIDVYQYVSHLLFERYEQLRHGQEVASPVRRLKDSC